MGRTIVACAAIVLVAGALAGCRQEEQGRPLAVDKGAYKGQPDTALNEAQVRALTDRAALQGDIGPSAVPTGGGAPAAPGASLPPKAQERVQESAPLPEKALSDRLRLQSGN